MGLPFANLRIMWEWTGHINSSKEEHSKPEGDSHCAGCKQVMDGQGVACHTNIIPVHDSQGFENGAFFWKSLSSLSPGQDHWWN